LGVLRARDRHRAGAGRYQQSLALALFAPHTARALRAVLRVLQHSGPVLRGPRAGSHGGGGARDPQSAALDAGPHLPVRRRRIVSCTRSRRARILGPTANPGIMIDFPQLVARFNDHLAFATREGIFEPTAFSLATVGPDGLPSVR